MISKIVNIYSSEDLVGEIFMYPLKKFNAFFARKIQHSPLLEACAWSVAAAVLGIFTYSVFVPVAGLGMLVKLTGINDIAKHNQEIKEKLKLRFERFSLGSVHESSDEINSDACKMVTVKSYGIVGRGLNIENKKVIQNEVDKEIDFFTQQYNKIYLATKMDKDKISIELKQCQILY